MPRPLLLPQLFHLRLSRGSLTSFATIHRPALSTPATVVAIIEYDCTDSFGNLLSLNKHIERNKLPPRLYPIVIFGPLSSTRIRLSLTTSSLVLIPFERNKGGGVRVGSRGLDEIR